MKKVGESWKSMSDAQKYRTKEEVSEYQKIDPINNVLETIKKNKYATQKEIEKINQEVKNIIADAVSFAEESAFPKEQDLYDSVYEQKSSQGPVRDSSCIDHFLKIKRAS